MAARRMRGAIVVIVSIGSLLGFGVWAQLGSAGAAGPDTIQYVQQTGSGGTYIRYVPGDGSPATTQAVTGGGGCATPTVSGPPVLAFSARSYPNGYPNPSSSAIVGAFKSRTGVCAITQTWSIEANEGLRFSVGSNPLTAGRVFARAQLRLEREDKTTSSSQPVSVQLVEFLANAQVGTQTIPLAGAQGAQITADTGVATSAFDTVEIRVLSPATGSISVVGPTSTFTLANVICVSDTISTTSNDGTATSGEVSATITYAGNTVDPARCKAYTDFSATTTSPDSTNGKLVDFLATQTAGAHITTHFDWGLFTYCRPDASVPGVPNCPTTFVDFGAGAQPQVYCAAANPPATPQWCTVRRTFEYVTIGTTTFTHITEDWDGFGDVRWAFR